MTVSTASALRERVEEITRGVEGVFGVAATHLASGARFGWNDDALFPLASVVKLPLLVALYAEVRAGRVDLGERVTYARRDVVVGSGVLRHLDDGLRPTVRDLATLMIIVSDNTATDLLLARVTKAAVERAMDELGLSSIRVPMGIHEMFCELVDMTPEEGRADPEELRRRLRMSHGSGGRSIVPELGDRGTPRDLCRLFELLERRAILDAASCDEILEICKRQQASSRIPARLPESTETAHKTGTIRGVRNDVGVVYGPTGPYAVALLSRALRDGEAGNRALADVSLAIFEWASALT